MQKLLAKIAMVAMLGSMLFIAPVSTQAVTVPLWDVTGTYVWDVLGTYFHDFTITTQNPDGTFVGTAGYPAGGAPYTDPNETTETVTGQVVGNTITFTVVYQGPYAPGSTFNMTGTIDSNGHISGTSPWNWQLTGDSASPINQSMVVVSGNTSAGENQPGWLFNRDTNTATLYTFNTALPSIGTGSLYVAPIGTNASDKFIAENFINAKIADVNSVSYDFAIGSGGDTSDAGQFYMNVYANFGVSDDNKFYDCRYSVVPTVGVVNGFTTVIFDPTQAYPVVTRGNSPHLCPAVPADMDLQSPGSNIRVFALNVGDTSVNDQGLDGYLDNVVVSLNTGITTYDFEPNIAPVANDSTITTNEDTAVNSFVTATDVNTPPQTLTYSVVAGPSNGVISGFNSSTGAYTYTPNADYVGSDTFTFKANDGVADSNIATVSITVDLVNDAPVANNSAISTTVNIPVSSSVTATDADLPAQTLTYSVASNPTNGTVVLNSSTGAYTYTPDTGYAGSDSFTFTANDGSADSNVATVSITVDHIPAPTNKDQCKNDGWKVFTNPSFKNQGQCVAFTNHLE